MLSVCCFFVKGSYLMATVAGTGSSSSSGNGGPATSAGLSQFYGMWVDSVGNIFIPDPPKLQLRKVDTVGIINAFIGSGSLSTAGVGGPALSVALDGVACAYGDTAGNIYFSTAYVFIWFYNHTSGYVSRFAGAAPGGPGYSGDGGPATSAKLSIPTGLFLSSNGIFYVADSSNGVIRAIDTRTNIITTIAGSNTATDLGDGGPATSAMLRSPYGVSENTAGVLYIGDTFNRRVRKIVNGIITTVAGTGLDIYNGENITATKANLATPYNCQEDSSGNLYISDNGNGRVRIVSASNGNITTIAGTASGRIANGSLHVATTARIIPTMLQLDSLGNIYFGDYGYVRKLFTTAMPTPSPTAVPTDIPTAIPSIVPTAIPTEIPSIVPTAIPTAVPSIVPTAIPTAVPSIVPSTIPTTSPSVMNVTVESSSRSQRLSDVHIFYATFFPAFFVVFCILPIVAYYLWRGTKGEGCTSISRKFCFNCYFFSREKADEIW